MNSIKKFILDDTGVTAIEYGLIAALIAVVIVGGVTAIGGRLVTTFNEILVALGGTAAP